MNFLFAQQGTPKLRFWLGCAKNYVRMLGVCCVMVVGLVLGGAPLCSAVRGHDHLVIR